MKIHLKIFKTLFIQVFKRLVIICLSDYAKIRYGSWWAVREEGLKRDDKWGSLLSLIFEYQVAREGGWIGRGARFAGPPCFPHGMKGIFISDEAQVGKRCVLFQHTMIVSSHLVGHDRNGAPRVGDDVYLACGAIIVGPVMIGDGCRLGTHVVVHHDLDAHSVAVCQPARVIQRLHPMDNRHLSVGSDGVSYTWEENRWVKLNQKN